MKPTDKAALGMVSKSLGWRYTFRDASTRIAFAALFILVVSGIPADVPDYLSPLLQNYGDVFCRVNLSGRSEARVIELGQPALEILASEGPLERGRDLLVVLLEI